MTKILNEQIFKHLTFPDCNINNFEFSSKNKKLKIFVDSAWLDLDGGQKLNEGILFFSEWQNLFIQVFCPRSEKWTKLDVEEYEPLRDICEIIYNNSNVQLSGFGKNLGLWTEWNIQNANMKAEFA